MRNAEKSIIRSDSCETCREKRGNGEKHLQNAVRFFTCRLSTDVVPKPPARQRPELSPYPHTSQRNSLIFRGNLVPGLLLANAEDWRQHGEQLIPQREMNRCGAGAFLVVILTQFPFTASVSMIFAQFYITRTAKWVFVKRIRLSPRR